MRTTVIFCLGLVGGILATGLALISAKYELKLDTALGALGVIVGVLGLVFAAYFGVLAVDAFGHLKILKDSTEKASIAVSSISKQTDDVTALKLEAATLSETVYQAGDHLFVSLAAFVSSMPRTTDPQKRKLAKLSEEIVLSRSKMALTNIYIAEDDLRTHVLTLMEKGTSDDVYLLEKILSKRELPTDLVGFIRQSLITLKSKPPGR